jgi:hypothetical protein
MNRMNKQVLETTADAAADSAVEAATQAAIFELRRLSEHTYGSNQAHPLAILIDPVLSNPLEKSSEPLSNPLSHPLTQTHHLLRQALQNSVGYELITVPIKYEHLPDALRPVLLLISDEARSERLVNATLRLGVEEAMGLHDDVETQTSPRSVCAWLLPPPSVQTSQTTQPLALQQWVLTMAEHMARQAVIRVPEDVSAPAGEPRLWRYFDPRGFERFASSFSEVQRNCLLGPAHLWLYVQQLGSRLGQLQGVAHAHEDTTQSMQMDTETAQAWSQATPTLQPNPLQWQMAARVGPLHLAWRRCQAWHLVSTTAPQPNELDALLARAQAWGLAGSEDLLLFAHKALTLHAQFDQHPAVRLALSALQAQVLPNGLTEALASVAPQAWEQIAALAPEDWCTV